MTDAVDRPRHDPDLTERALALITAGHTLLALGAEPKEDPESSRPTTRQIARLHRDREIDDTLRTYFGGVRRPDIVAELQILESWEPSRPEIMQEATKWLAAYFRWTAIENATLTSDEYPIEPLASRFAVAISARLAGPLRDRESTQPAQALPDWTNPDAAFGWRRAAGRPASPAVESRNEGIAAMWVKLTAEGVDSASREQRVGRAFGVKATVIHDVLRDYADHVAAFSADDGQRAIDEVITNARLPRTRSGK